MENNKPIRNLILGGGGHAKVVVDTILAAGSGEGFGILDTDSNLWGTDILGVPILGGDEMLRALVRRGASHFIVGLGGVGDNGPRRRLYELGLEHNLTPLALRHPSAVCSPFATIGTGSLLCPAAVVNAHATLGDNVIVNTGAIIEHDCAIGDQVHVATGARLASAVRVEPLAHVGAGATVLQGIHVGEGAIIGAGAVVIRDVEPWTVVVGVPARVLKRVQSNVPAYATTPARRT